VIELRVRRTLALALVVGGAVLPNASAQPVADPYQIVAGTWVSGWAGIFVGPAWWLDGPTQTYGVTMVGPDGFTKHMGGPNQRLPGMPSTRSTYWCNTTCGEKNPGGSWYAIGDGDHTKVTFTIDQSSRLSPLQITTYSGDAATFTATWNPEPDAKSFIAYVQDEGGTSAFDWIVGKILPAGSTTVTFADMGLNPEWGYEFNVFAYTGDITGATTPSVFNVASTRIDFVPGVLAKLGPQTGEPRFACYHGSMPGTLTTCSSHGGPACYDCDLHGVHSGPLIAVYRRCGVQKVGSGWSLSVRPSATCASARTTFHAYVSNSKCTTTGTKLHACSVSSYRCSYTKSGTIKYVHCTSKNGLVMFSSPV
jgi:hypothetical protein